MNEPTVYYIAGPMAGLPDYNRPAFFDAEHRLKSRPHTRVINPAVLPSDLPDRCYMPVCFAMLRESDAVLMLPGWQHSPSARLEFQYALRLGLPIFYSPDDLPVEK